MKMNSLRLIGATSVDLPLAGADASGPFVLKSAEGLGPPEINVRMARTVLEKATYQGKSAALRQIIALVGLAPDWDIGQTPEDLRTQLYSLLTPRYGQMVRVEVVNNGVVEGYALGQVSKFEVALFSKDPAVQIVIDCDYSYFLDPNEILQAPVQSTVGGIRAFDILNNGDAPSGFLMGLVLRANVGNTLILSDEDPRGMKIQLDGINWLSGDHLVIDTRPGSRGIWRGAQGAPLVSALNNLNGAVSEWMYLYGGDNRLLLNTTAFDWLPEYNFKHQPAYWGV